MAKNIAKIVLVVLIIGLLSFIAVNGLSLTAVGIPVEFHSVMDGEHGIRKGFDLTGGSVIVYEAEAESVTTEQSDTIRDIMRKRLDRLGFTEATVAKQGEKRVVIEIPSVTNPEDAIRTLGKTAKLHFVDSDGVEILTGDDVKDAKAQYGKLSQNGSNEHFVSLTLNSAAQQKFYEATTRMSQKSSGQNYISIMLDEDEYSRPSVKEPINSESCVISGDFDAESAKELATTIKEGQLPFKLNVVERRSSGPSLGDNALSTSLFAGLIGLLIILLFMIIVYRLPGVVAAISLIGYVTLDVLILALTRANLSLPGIAGIILSIGMAVDANVIIFERVKDELRLGKTVGAALNAGFHRALVAIIDANVTTAIAAVVLYIFGTGTIKGFAITLGLGIIVSMFTAIVLTKFLLKAFFGLNVKNRWLYGLSKKKDEGGEGNV